MGGHDYRVRPLPVVSTYRVTIVLQSNAFSGRPTRSSERFLVLGVQLDLIFLVTQRGRILQGQVDVP